MGVPPAWGLRLGLTTSHLTKKNFEEIPKETRIRTDSLYKPPKRRNMDMRFETWNVRSLYRAG
jgi:hypothetical protein